MRGTLIKKIQEGKPLGKGRIEKQGMEKLRIKRRHNLLHLLVEKKMRGRGGGNWQKLEKEADENWPYLGLPNGYKVE